MKKILLPLAICGFITLPVLSYGDTCNIDVCKSTTALQPILPTVSFDVDDGQYDPPIGVYRIFNCTTDAKQIWAYFRDQNGDTQINNSTKLKLQPCTRLDQPLQVTDKSSPSQRWFYYAFSLDSGKTCITSSQLQKINVAGTGNDDLYVVEGGLTDDPTVQTKLLTKFKVVGKVDGEPLNESFTSGACPSG